MSGIKVIIFDDNDSLRDSIGMLLLDTADFTLAGSYPDCVDVIRNINETKPDVVIMDIDVPGINGIKGVKLIRKNFPTVQRYRVGRYEGLRRSRKFPIWRSLTVLRFGQPGL